MEAKLIKLGYGLFSLFERLGFCGLQKFVPFFI